MTEPHPRRGWRAALVRWRAPLVLVPALAGIAYGGAVGAQMLWAEPSVAPAPEPVVTCWEGTESVASSCPPPTGRAGLRWVFPSFDPESERCRRVVYETSTAGPLEFRCRQPVQGERAIVSYSERSGLERGLAYFEQRYRGIEPARVAEGTRLLYREDAPRRGGTYEVTVAYATAPFAVTVAARNERLRDTVLDEAVPLRPARYLSVRPGPSPAPDPTGP